MRDGHLLIGYGMATAFYPAERAPASVQAILYANDTAVVRTASSDMGSGTYTAKTQLAAGTLGLPIERVHFELGDTDMPKAPVHGGSMTLASVGTAVVDACKSLIAKLPAGDAAEAHGARLRRAGVESLSAIGHSEPGDEAKQYSSAGFGAVFAEVRVDPDFGTIRVPRIVGAYDVGRVINLQSAGCKRSGGDRAMRRRAGDRQRSVSCHRQARARPADHAGEAAGRLNDAVGPSSRYGRRDLAEMRRGLAQPKNQDTRTSR